MVMNLFESLAALLTTLFNWLFRPPESPEEVEAKAVAARREVERAHAKALRAKVEARRAEERVWDSQLAALDPASNKTVRYEIGDVVEVDGRTFRSSTSPNFWGPEEAPEFWEEVDEFEATHAIGIRRAVRTDNPGEAFAWTAPRGRADAYNLGDVTWFDNQVWRSTLDGNVWKPGGPGWVAIPARLSWRK